MTICLFCITLVTFASFASFRMIVYVQFCRQQDSLTTAMHLNVTISFRSTSRVDLAGGASFHN